MSDTEAKTRPASKRKLLKLRRDGTVASGQEAAGLAGSAAALLTLASLAGVMAAGLAGVFDVAARLVPLPFEEAVGVGAAAIGRRAAGVLAPVAGAAVGVAVLAAVLFNRGVVLSLKPVAPQLGRVSPMAGLGRIYGRRGWIETAAFYVRILLWLGFAALAAWAWLPRIAAATECGLPCQAGVALPLGWLLAIGAVAVLALSAGADMLAQAALFRFEQRMTETEGNREQREQTGDPGIRRERRRLQREVPPEPGAIGVSKANMCFYDGDAAVAIRFHPDKAPVPRITAHARGADAARALRGAVRARGHPEIAHALIVRGCLAYAPGSAMSPALYEPFGYALRKAYGT